MAETNRIDTSGSSSSPEGDDLPAEKRLKTDEAPQPPTTAPSPLTNGSTKLTGTKTKKNMLPGASKYARPSNMASAASTSTGTKLGLGSTATSVVKKTTEELGASFKAAAADPDAREAYKALFHSADKERPKEKMSHWVTFFPYH